MALLFVGFCIYVVYKIICGAIETEWLRDQSRKDGSDIYVDSSGNLRNTITGEKLYK